MLSSPRTERARPLRRTDLSGQAGPGPTIAGGSAPVRGATGGAKLRRHEHPKSRPDVGFTSEFSRRSPCTRYTSDAAKFAIVRPQ